MIPLIVDLEWIVELVQDSSSVSTWGLFDSNTITSFSSLFLTDTNIPFFLDLQSKLKK